MTWTLTVDDTTVTITDTDAAAVQEQLDRVSSAGTADGTHFDYTADDGTEITVGSDSKVTLTRDR